SRFMEQIYSIGTGWTPFSFFPFRQQVDLGRTDSQERCSCIRKRNERSPKGDPKKVSRLPLSDTDDRPGSESEPFHSRGHSPFRGSPTADGFRITRAAQIHAGDGFAQDESDSTVTTLSTLHACLWGEKGLSFRIVSSRPDVAK